MCGGGSPIDDLWDSVTDPAKDLVGGAINIAGDALETVGDVAENIIKNPLPVIQTVALTAALGPVGTSIGLSTAATAAVAGAAITAMNGGKIEDIALAAGTSYLGTKVGEIAGSTAATSEAVKAMDEATKITIQKVVTGASSSAATVALRGGSLEDVLQAGTTAAVGSYVRTTLTMPANLGGYGFDPRALDTTLITTATAAATRAVLNGKSIGDAVAMSSTVAAIGMTLSGNVDKLRSSDAAYQRVYDDFSSLKDKAANIFDTEIKPLQDQVQTEFNEAKSLSTEYDKNLTQYQDLVTRNAEAKDVYNAFANKPTDDSVPPLYYNKERYEWHYTNWPSPEIGLIRVVPFGDVPGLYSQEGGPVSRDFFLNEANNTATEANRIATDVLNPLAVKVEDAYRKYMATYETLGDVDYVENVKEYEAYVARLNELAAEASRISVEQAKLAEETSKLVIDYEFEAAKVEKELGEKIQVESVKEAEKLIYIQNATKEAEAIGFSPEEAKAIAEGFYDSTQASGGAKVAEAIDVVRRLVRTDVDPTGEKWYTYGLATKDGNLIPGYVIGSKNGELDGTTTRLNISQEETSGDGSKAEELDPKLKVETGDPSLLLDRVLEEQDYFEERDKTYAGQQAEIDRQAEEERIRVALEESERQRLANEEAERVRLVAEEAEREAERLRIEAEEAERQRVLSILLEEERERQRQAAEEAERARLAAEEAAAEAERQRIAAEEAERERQLIEEEERRRIEAEEAERQRLEAEEAERQRLAAEEDERNRLATEEAERQRLAAEEAERLRLETEESERQRLAAEEAERLRLANEEAERTRLAAEEAERQRLTAEEQERARLAAEEAAAEAERLRIQSEEMARLEAERVAAIEEARRAELAEEERLRLESEEMARIEAERVAAIEEAERIRLAEEEAEGERLRLESEEMARIEAERVAAIEAAERARLAEEERLRLEAEQSGGTGGTGDGTGGLGPDDQGDGGGTGGTGDGDDDWDNVPNIDIDGVGSEPPVEPPFEPPFEPEPEPEQPPAGGGSTGGGGTGGGTTGGGGITTAPRFNLNPAFVAAMTGLLTRNLSTSNSGINAGNFVIPELVATRQALEKSPTGEFISPVQYTYKNTGEAYSPVQSTPTVNAAQGGLMLNYDPSNSVQMYASGGITGQQDMYKMLISKGYTPQQAQAYIAQQSQPSRSRKTPVAKETDEQGLMSLAKGGNLPPRYLNGATDGMADKIPAKIGAKQPAALSHGEFVIPADVVSHLGNGNSEAGAQVLYNMMDKIRKARTGTTKQGKQINPNKFLPKG